MAHWITFKEDQRLEWQQKYLTQLCEGDQEIREANELIQEFTTMLRERKGECFDAWLEKVEQQGIPELLRLCAVAQKRLRGGESWIDACLVSRASGGACASSQASQAPGVWSGELPDAAQAGAAMQLEKPLKGGATPNHQNCGRASML